MVRSGLIASFVFLAAVFGNALAAEPTGEMLLTQAHDCVIQPFIVAVWATTRLYQSTGTL